MPSCDATDETLTIAPRRALSAGAQARVIWNGPTTLVRKIRRKSSAVSPSRLA